MVITHSVTDGNSASGRAMVPDVGGQWVLLADHYADLTALREQLATAVKRAETAESTAVNHTEGLRGIREMLSADTPDIERAILWCSDSLGGYVETHAETMLSLLNRVNAAEAALKALPKIGRLVGDKIVWDVMTPGQVYWYVQDGNAYQTRHVYGDRKQYVDRAAAEFAIEEARES